MLKTYVDENSKKPLPNGQQGEEAAVSEKVPTMWETIWREIKSSKAALFALFFFTGLIITAFIVSANLDMEAFTRVNLRAIDQSPDWFAGPHFLGTDPGGRDVLAQLIVGARFSFVIALSVTLITGVWGVLYGLIAGYYGGHIENVMMRILDFFIMVPTLMSTIAIISIIPNYEIWHFILVLSLFTWMGRARLIRSATLRQSALDYVHASKTLGTPNIVIVFREVLPNVTSIIVMNAVISLALNMGMETTLTILGYGLPFGTPSLGRMNSFVQNPIVLTQRLWQWLPASILIFILILCIYIVGNTISRAVDPKQQQQK